MGTTFNALIILLLITTTAHAGIALNGLQLNHDVPIFAKRNGKEISNLGDLVDYWQYLKRNHLLEQMLDDDYRRLQILARKFNVTIPRKKPNNGAIVYCGSRIVRPKLLMEVSR